MKKIIGLFLIIFSSACIAATTVPVQLINPAGSTGGQAVVSTGASSAPSWGGIGVNGIASIAANTVLANVTGTSASPTAFSMPSCSASALQYISGTGFVCASAITLSGAFTPSQTAGIVGTTTNNNANAGSVGEDVTATGSGVSLTSATAANITSVSLTAGDWRCVGVVSYTPAGSTTTSIALSGINTTSATFGAVNTYQQFTYATSAGGGNAIAAPLRHLPLASTTTVYLIGYAGFAVSTMTAGGTIDCWRGR